MRVYNLKSPLFVSWSEQYVRLYLADRAPGTPLSLTVNGQPTPFQYTGASVPAGAEILVKLGLAKGESKELMTVGSGQWTVGSEQNQRRIEIPIREGVAVGMPGRDLAIFAPGDHPHPDPLPSSWGLPANKAGHRKVHPLDYRAWSQ